MRMYDLIDKKKKNDPLSRSEIEAMVTGYVDEKIPDYQMAAFLMAVCFNGMTDEELLYLTNAMADSGERIDLSAIQGTKVDKHSTGGVGDKTTLIIAPIVAACGGKVAKMSGRGLGFTGGTADKLEAIPGYRMELSDREFFQNVNEIGVSVMGQSADIAPADKKMYALRDVTATVDSIPLIAASVMSKKLAAGSDKILLDVTVGSGAFMKKTEDAVLLAEKMVSIGEGAGKETIALITNMDVPLGSSVGNTMEVIEAIEVLSGKGQKDLLEVCRHLAANMLHLSGKGTMEECFSLTDEAIRSGKALECFAAMAEAQGGDASYIRNPDKFEKAAFKKDVTVKEAGYISHMDTERCGRTAVILGAGRETREDKIDMAAGIRFYKKTGDKVTSGDILATLYSSKEENLEEAAEYLMSSYEFSTQKPDVIKEILARVTKDGVELF